MNKKFVILISGPTGTGKSDFVVQLAHSLYNKVEFVNADIGSFYTQLTIGTAKPDWQSSTIPHHFFDVISEPVSWTAPQFREKLEILIQDIWSRGNIPVIVGGSAFYIQSFFYKNHELATPSPELVADLENQPVDLLWEQLHTIDPVRAEKIDRNDHYRLVRALAIWHTQGQKPSEFQQIFDPLAPFCFITLTRDRDQLYDMIDQRVQHMINIGWIEEVRSLLDDPAWIDFMIKKKMIGYDLLMQYLLGYHAERSFDEIISLIAQRTRNYAKRQITFLKKLQKNVNESMLTGSNYSNWYYKIEEYNLTASNLDALLDRVKEEIAQF